MNPTTWSGREVQNVGPKGVRRWQATLVGNEVRTAAWTGAATPRVAVKAHASREKAGVELIKALRKKMLEDFVFLRPDAGPGELVFAMALPGGGPADNFDVTPDGQTLVVGAGRGDPRARIVRASLTTGEVERIDIVPDPGSRQLFIHGALVDAGGTAVTFGLNEHVRRLELRTGAWKPIASVLHRGREHVNPFCVEPQRDAAHRRVLLVHKQSLEARDLAGGAVLFAAPIGTKTAECRRIALSPSGALAAAHVVSRHIVYGHDDARGDRTNEVQIWRIDDGEPITRVPLGADHKPGHLSFTLDDHALLLDTDQGTLVRVDLQTHQQTKVLDFGDHAVWDWTPEGDLAVLDGVDLAIRDPGTFNVRSSVPLEAQRSQRLRCAAGLVVIGGEGSFLAYRR